MRNQRIHQRPGFVAGRRVHHEPRGLVDDDDVVVFMDDIERDVFALRRRIGRLRHVDYDRIALGHVISGVADGGGFDGNAIYCDLAYCDLAGLDQRLQPGTRQVGQALRQHAVEPGRSLVACDDDFKLMGAVSD